MSHTITLPALGESVTEGTVTRWLKHVGESVAVGEPLLEVSTDKVDTEIPSPVSGVLLEISAEVDSTVEVGAPLGLIGEPGKSSAPAVSSVAQDLGGDIAHVAADPSNFLAEAARAGDQPLAGAGDLTVTLPALGESITEGTISRWLKAPGDEVALDEPLVEVSTDKIDTEIPSPIAGTLLSIRAGEDETVEVGDVIAVIGRATRAADARPRNASRASSEGDEVASDPPPSDAAPSEHETQPASSSPASHPRSGAVGSVRDHDADSALSLTSGGPASSPLPHSPESQASALRGRTVSVRPEQQSPTADTTERAASVAPLTAVTEVDVTAVDRLCLAHREAFQTREGVGLTFTAFLAKAIVDTLKTHPRLNASIDLGCNEVRYHDREHLALVVSTDRGLVAPVIRNAGELSVSGLAKKIADLAHRARSNSVSVDQLSEGTFTFVNAGSRGPLFGTAPIHAPQVATLCAGKIAKRAVVVDEPSLGETIAVRKVVHLAVTYDERLVGRDDASSFLSAVKDRLEGAHFDL